MDYTVYETLIGKKPEGFTPIQITDSMVIFEKPMKGNISIRCHSSERIPEPHSFTIEGKDEDILKFVYRIEND